MTHSANGSGPRGFSGTKTVHYRPSLPMWRGYNIGGRREFIPRDVEDMRFDPQCAFALRVLYSPLPTVQAQVSAESAEVGKWVKGTWDRIWERELGKLFLFAVYGWCAGELLWDTSSDEVAFDRLKDLHPFDVIPLERAGCLAGISLRNTSIDGQDRPWLLPPRSFYLANEPEFGQLWGRSRMRAAWSAWKEKSERHGATEIRRMWFLKNAYRSGYMRHPGGSRDLGDGQFKACEDIAREIAELAETGHIPTLPSDRDDEGNLEWEWVEPVANGDIPGIAEYMKSLDRDIFVAMGIPPEVVEAAASGSGWSGRSVPFLVYLKGEDGLADSMMHAIREQVLDVGVCANFGPEAVSQYKIRLKSLVPDDSEEGDGQAGGGDAGAQSGLAGGSDWQPYKGKKGGSGLKNPATGAIRYGAQLSLDVPEGLEWEDGEATLEDYYGAGVVRMSMDAVVRMAADAAQHKPGEVWKGPSGRWFTKRQDGRTVPAKNPQQQEYEGWKAKRAEKFGQGPAIPKGDVGKVSERLKAAAAGKPLEGDTASTLATALMSLTTKQVAELKRELGLKASGPKAELARKVAERAVALAKASGEEKPAEVQKEAVPEAPKAEASGEKPAEAIPVIPRKQFDEAQSRHPGMMILYRVGDQYIVPHDDAATAGKMLGMPVGKAADGSPAVTFPHSELETRLRSLLKGKQRVAIAEVQGEQASQKLPAPTRVPVDPEPAKPAAKEAPAKAFKGTGHAADELQAIREALAGGDDEGLQARVDAVGQWAAKQKNSKAISKILDEAHSLSDRLAGGSGKGGNRIKVTEPAPAPSSPPSPAEGEPGFTGTDSQGREWRDGELVARVEEAKPAEAPAPAQPAAEAKAASQSFAGGEDAHAWGQKNYAGWADSLSKDEYKAVGRYRMNEYREINEALRGGKGEVPAKVKDRVALIDAALDRASTPEDVTAYPDMTVHRGLGADVVAGMKPGEVFTDQGYISTSLNPEVGEMYGTATMEIRVPKGSKGAYITAIERRKDTGTEQEFLLPRGTSMRIVSVSDRDGKPHVVAEVVPARQPAPAQPAAQAKPAAPDALAGVDMASLKAGKVYGLVARGGKAAAEAILAARPDLADAVEEALEDSSGAETAPVTSQDLRDRAAREKQAAATKPAVAGVADLDDHPLGQTPQAIRQGLNDLTGKDASKDEYLNRMSARQEYGKKMQARTLQTVLPEQEPAILGAAVADMAAQDKANPFRQPKIADVYKSVKAKHPDLSMADFQAVLARGHAAGHVRLGAFTQAAKDIPDSDIASVLPMDGELKLYASVGAKPLPASPAQPTGVKHFASLPEPDMDAAVAQAAKKAADPRHGIISIPDLADAIIAAHPGATPADVRKALERMERQGKLTLQKQDTYGFDAGNIPRAAEMYQTDRGLMGTVQLHI